MMEKLAKSGLAVSIRYWFYKQAAWLNRKQNPERYERIQRYDNAWKGR